MKQNSRDFNPNDLPTNRVELFFDVIKNNWRNLLLIGLILFVFSIPMIGCAYYFDYIDASLYQDFLKGVYTEAQYFSYYKLDRILCALFSTLGLMILSIGVGGAMKIIKKMCFLEPYFFKEDYLSGMKENSPLMLLISLTGGLCMALATFVFFLDMNGVTKGISIGIPVLVVFPVLLLMIPMNALYKVRFLGAYLNGFKLFIKHLFKNTLFYILMMAPLALMFIPNILIKYMGGSLFILIFVPLFLVGLFDYSLDLFDESINKEKYPSYYRKGLYGEKTLRKNHKHKQS